MKRVPKPVLLYYFTDPDTADRVMAHGFEGAGVFSRQASVTLFDSPLNGMGGSVLRVNIAAEIAASAQQFLQPSDGEGRRWTVPLRVVRDASISKLDV